MGKEQNKNMPDKNDRSFVKAQTTDTNVRTVSFASTPIPGGNAAGIEADVKAFLAFTKELKNK